MKQLARTLRRRGGVAMAEVDRLTGEVAAIARQSLRESRRSWATPVLAWPADLVMAAYTTGG
jgi:hypothetical protein